MSLTFDAEKHQYFWQATPVVNVTRALSLLTDFSKVPKDVLENARLEGVDQHRMVELYMADILDEDNLPELLRPKLSGLKKFIADTGFVVIASEQKVYHRLYRYAGTLDLIGDMRYGKNNIRATIDIKRSFMAGRAIGLQTAGYTEAWADQNPGSIKPSHRFALRFTDGDYRLEEFPMKDDFALFLSCLSVYRLKETL